MIISPKTYVDSTLEIDLEPATEEFRCLFNAKRDDNEDPYDTILKADDLKTLTLDYFDLSAASVLKSYITYLFFEKWEIDDTINEFVMEMFRQANERMHWLETYQVNQLTYAMIDSGKCNDEIKTQIVLSFDHASRSENNLWLHYMLPLLAMSRPYEHELEYFSTGHMLGYLHQNLLFQKQSHSNERCMDLFRFIPTVKKCIELRHISMRDRWDIICRMSLLQLAMLLRRNALKPEYNRIGHVYVTYCDQTLTKNLKETRPKWMGGTYEDEETARHRNGR